MFNHLLQALFGSRTPTDLARVAERADRADTALHLLAALDQSAQHYRLAIWEPSLAFEVKHQLVRLLKFRLMRKACRQARLGATHRCPDGRADRH
ncbi:hypothetical protein AWV80_30295 [Cupriavidus sp. UYMU48A]|nr:hypothetical protein AWV80_30295 [Cupriavidus sp. UYMU48A]